MILATRSDRMPVSTSSLVGGAGSSRRPTTPEEGELLMTSSSTSFDFRLSERLFRVSSASSSSPDSVKYFNKKEYNAWLVYPGPGPGFQGRRQVKKCEATTHDQRDTRAYIRAWGRSLSPEQRLWLWKFFYLFHAQQKRQILKRPLWH